MVKEFHSRQTSQDEDDNGLKEGREGESWEEICLQKFSQCMGLSMEGFEGDFMELMTKANQRRIKGKGKGGIASTKFERELKKLEWTVKDKGSLNLGAQGKGTRGSITIL